MSIKKINELLNSMEVVKQLHNQPPVASVRDTAIGGFLDLDTLHELAAYLDDRMDINHFGGPNTAMRLHTEVCRAIAKAEKS